MRRGSLVPLVLALFVAGVACTSTKTGARSTPPAGSPTATNPVGPSPSPPPHPVSLPALMQRTYDGDGLTLGRVLARASSYTRYFVTYKSAGLTISGVMNIPKGDGPFPTLVLAHGYIDPDVYVNGQGLRREQEYLATHGYAVLHTDYRNHASSSDDPNAEFNLRLGYTEDAINAVLAIKQSNLSSLDKNRIGLLGRSMGGGVGMNVAVVQPGLVKAVVLFAPVSSDVVDNFNKWIRGSDDRRALAGRIVDAHGSPEANPAFWRGVSPVTFFDRISVPIMIHQGTSDDSVNPAWTDKTVAALRAAGKNVTYHVYEGEQHAFGPQWPLSMQRTDAFFKATL